MTKTTKVWNVFFVLLGVAALVLKHRYAGPFEDAVYSYGGNVAASFSVYFVIGVLTLPARCRKLLTAGIALLVVESFEATNGFGVMSNVYDRTDFVANSVGIGMALAVDTLASRLTTRSSTRTERTASPG